MVKVSEGKRVHWWRLLCSERKNTLFAKVLCACASEGHLAGKVVQETKDGGGAHDDREREPRDSSTSSSSGNRSYELESGGTE